MTIHDSLNNFENWVEIDVTNKPTRKIVLGMIQEDNKLDSPTIIKNIDGRYSPFIKHLGLLWNTQLNVLKFNRILTN